MKAILMSVGSEQVLNILNGKQTLIIRKSAPKDFIGWVYIYCTKSHPYLIKHPYHSYMIVSDKTFDNLNGKVLARFWFNEFKEINTRNRVDVEKVEENMAWFEEYACMPTQKILDYILYNDKFYVWNIKRLEAFEETKELDYFYEPHRIPKSLFDINESGELGGVKITKAPSNWQHVFIKEN